MKRIPIQIVFAAVFACAAVIPAGHALGAGDRTLGVYFDAEGTQCSGTIIPGVPATVYILAKIAPGGPGIHGFEFRFTGTPVGWTLYPVPMPDMLVFGDPFADGAGAGFYACQEPGGGVVRIYTVLVLASVAAENVRFEIQAPVHNSNPGFHCPLVLNCDEPFYSMTCVEGGACAINASHPMTCDDLTAIEPAAWSRVKGLYQ